MPREIARRHQIDPTHPEAAAEAMAEVCKRAHRYAQQPTEVAWDDLVRALRRAYGDDEAFDRLTHRRRCEVLGEFSPSLRYRCLRRPAGVGLANGTSA